MRFVCGFHRTSLNLQPKPSIPTVQDTRCRRPCFDSPETNPRAIEWMRFLLVVRRGLLPPTSNARTGDVLVLRRYPGTEARFSWWR